MKIISTLLFLIISIQVINCQTTVEGKVTDGQTEMPGVSLYFPSTFEGTSSNVDGTFSFSTSLSGDQWLHYQFLGFKQDSILIELDQKSTQINIKLEVAANKLAEVIVNAGVFEASDTRKTAILTPIDIVTTGASGDLADALAILPGTTTQGETGQLIVRGGEASETQAVLNGLRIPKFYQGTVQDVPSRSRFSPFDFQGISFATGGFSVEYGEALSAVLALNTPGMPEQSRWSIGLMTIGASLAHTRKMETSAVSVATNYVNIYPYLMLNGREDDFTTAPTNMGFQVGYWNSLKNGGLLKLYSQSSNDKVINTQEENQVFYGSNKIGLKNTNSYNQLVYQQANQMDGLFQAAISYAYDNQQFIVDQGLKGLKQQDYQVRAKMTGEWDQSVLWQVGAEFAHRNEQVGFGENVVETLAEAGKNYGAGFLEGNYVMSSHWMARIGLRADAYDEGTVHLAPRFSLNYLMNKNEQFGFSVGRFNQRDADESAYANVQTIGPEKADHLILTYQGKWQGRVIRMEAYYKNYSDLALTTGQQLSNQGEGFSRGLDLFYRERLLIKQGDIWISASFNDNKRKWGNINELSKTPFSPEYSLAVVYKHFFPKPSLGLAFTYRYHNGRYYQNPNVEGNYQERAPQYHDLSMNLSYLTNFKGHFTVIFASLNNVPGLNQVHSYRYGPEADANGVFPQLEVNNFLTRFPFVGVFMNINETNDSISKDDL